MPPTQAVESVLEEIDLEIIDPFTEGNATQYLQGTMPIPRPTPPPYHNQSCGDAYYAKMRQNSEH